MNLSQRLPAGLVLGLILCTAASAEAQQFYNPWLFHRTRQALTNRAITRRLGRSSKPAPSGKRPPRRVEPRRKPVSSRRVR